MMQFFRDWTPLIALIGGISLIAYLISDGSNSSLTSNDNLQQVEAGTFHGYACSTDCSGHKAGYAWAERKGITSPDDCGGKSQSFIEGCKAYAEDRF